MQNVPEQLDGATVISVAPSTPGQTGIDYQSGEPIAIEYFAVAQYPDDQPRAYLFGVSVDHRVVCDYLDDSIEEAQMQAVRNGWVQPSAWRPRG